MKMLFQIVEELDTTPSAFMRENLATVASNIATFDSAVCSRDIFNFGTPGCEVNPGYSVRFFGFERGEQ